MHSRTAINSGFRLALPHYCTTLDPPTALLSGAILDYGVNPAVSLLQHGAENGAPSFECTGRPATRPVCRAILNVASKAPRGRHRRRLALYRRPPEAGLPGADTTAVGCAQFRYRCRSRCQVIFACSCRSKAQSCSWPPAFLSASEPQSDRHQNRPRSPTEYRDSNCVVFSFWSGQTR